MATKERMIGGRRYTVTTLGAMRAFRLFPLAMRAFSPKGGVKASGKVDGEEVMAAFLVLKPDEIELLTRELFDNALVDGKKLLDVMEVLLAGEVTTLIEVLAFAIEVNYAGFSDAATTPPVVAEGSTSTG